jgi:histone H3/H4
MIRPLQFCDVTRSSGEAANSREHWGLLRAARDADPAGWEETMAARKKKKAARSGGDLIISKARTKAAVKKCNVGGEFYGALDQAVREIIKGAESRALGNKRKTLKAVDL